MKAIRLGVAAIAVAALTAPAQAQALSVPKALIVAGGGGGAASGATSSVAGGNGQTGTAGADGTGGGAGAGGNNGSGGQAGTSIYSYNGGGGAGLLGDGGSGGRSDATGGMSAPSFAGGAAYPGGPVGLGGFGGGGGGNSGGGGGGGYSGGGGGSSVSSNYFGGVGGGGGSFVDASLSRISSAVDPLTATSYSGTGGNGQITILSLADSRAFRFDYSGAQVSFTIDTTGLYSIFVTGGQGGAAATASGGSFGGLGAAVGAQGLLTAGSTLSLLVGGGGQSVPTNSGGGGGGGGGGSFVFLTSIGQPVAAVPEPAGWAMMIVGFGLVGTAARRRRATAAPIA